MPQGTGVYYIHLEIPMTDDGATSEYALSPISFAKHLEIIRNGTLCVVLVRYGAFGTIYPYYLTRFSDFEIYYHTPGETVYLEFCLDGTVHVG